MVKRRRFSIVGIEADLAGNLKLSHLRAKKRRALRYVQLVSDDKKARGRKRAAACWEAALSLLSWNSAISAP